jgi:hypothetical protein
LCEKACKAHASHKSVCRGVAAGTDCGFNCSLGRHALGPDRPHRGEGSQVENDPRSPLQAIYRRNPGVPVARIWSAGVAGSINAVTLAQC